MKTRSFLTARRFEALWFLLVFFAIFGAIGSRMGVPNMLNTLMHTAYSLLIDTVFYLMAIIVLTGALSKLLLEFGVVRLLELALRWLMKPLFGLPGVAALGAVLTFLSDNPAIMSLQSDRYFSRYFKKYQLISLTNFSTAFGMGLVVAVFMSGLGFARAAFVGMAGAFVGGVVATRLMQRFVLRAHPEFHDEPSVSGGDEQKISFKSEERSVFLRVLSACLDGGKTGVELGLTIIPGVLIISTFVMMLTFGPSADGTYTGSAYEGVALLPFLAGKCSAVLQLLFGFESPELVAFPVTSLGAVGAALGLVPRFVADPSIRIDDNTIAVFTAMGMCWSGFLSTHAAVLDSLGYRHLLSKDILAQIAGGIVAGVAAHALAYLIC